jgi:hypothetical protein
MCEWLFGTEGQLCKGSAIAVSLLSAGNDEESLNLAEFPLESAGVLAWNVDD